MAPRTVNAFILRRSSQQNLCHWNPDHGKIEKPAGFGAVLVNRQECLAYWVDDKVGIFFLSPSKLAK
jgi:hypothetical protein